MFSRILESFTEDAMDCMEAVNKVVPHLALRYENLEIVAAAGIHVGETLRAFVDQKICSMSEARKLLRYVERMALGDDH